MKGVLRETAGLRRTCPEGETRAGRDHSLDVWLDKEGREMQSNCVREVASEWQLRLIIVLEGVALQAQSSGTTRSRLARWMSKDLHFEVDEAR